MTVFTSAARKREFVSDAPVIRAINGFAPFIGENTWIAPNATVVGDVHLGTECSVWYQAVLRGDVGKILVGDYTNIQDGAILHTTTGKSTVKLGNYVTVGHRAIVHGCHTEDHVLIGMGAIVLDNAQIGEGAVIAAGAVVKENTKVDSGSLWAGVPAVKVKEFDPGISAEKMRKMAEAYATYKNWYS
jgi:carbonic anhydrase/acetyltransferase-like protein (isoleucine patch superfamily)